VERAGVCDINAQTELLADDLKALTGWGINPLRLATKAVLRQLARVETSLPRITAGCIIERYLVAGIGSISGGDFKGRRYDGHTLQRAYRLEFGIEQSNCTAPARQYRVMQVLGLDYSYDSWRKNPRNQRAFMVLLADHLVQTSA
jgi:hypothetical protein